jgi:cell division protein FtsB
MDGWGRDRLTTVCRCNSISEYAQEQLFLGGNSMNRVLIVIIAILFFTFVIQKTDASETRSYLSRSDLEKIIAQKDATIGRLTKEIEVLKEKITTLQAEQKLGNGANSTDSPKKIPAEMEKTSKDLPLTFLCEKTQWNNRNTTYVWGKVVNDSDIPFRYVKVFVTAVDNNGEFLGRNTHFCEPSEINTGEIGYIERGFVETDKIPDKLIFKIIGEQEPLSNINKKAQVQSNKSSTSIANLNNNSDKEEKPDKTENLRRDAAEASSDELREHANSPDTTTKTIYGLKFHENISDLQKRMKITRTDDYEQGSVQEWRMLEPPADLELCEVLVYENKACGFDFIFKDASTKNFETIKKALNKKYGEPTQENVLGLLTKYFTKIDNIDIEIWLFYNEEQEELCMVYKDIAEIEKRAKEIEKYKKEIMETNL